MTDRELLELAAKAAGVEHTENEGRLYVQRSLVHKREWNPLTDDGDALRLAVNLHVDLRFCWDGCDDQFDTVIAERGKLSAHEQIGMMPNGDVVDENAATRRAVVRAAAEIGRSKGLWP
jgi:hypothetical protein